MERKADGDCEDSEIKGDPGTDSEAERDLDRETEQEE